MSTQLSQPALEKSAKVEKSEKGDKQLEKDKSAGTKDRLIEEETSEKGQVKHLEF